MSQPSTHRERAEKVTRPPRDRLLGAVPSIHRYSQSCREGREPPMIVANAGIKTQDATAPIGRPAHRPQIAVLGRNRGYMACPGGSQRASRTLAR